MKVDNPLISPFNQQELTQHSAHLLSDGEVLWPFINDIAYLRGNIDLREKAVFYIQKNDLRSAISVLLKDQDSFAPLPPPDDDAVFKILDQECGFLKSMRLLNYGPVTEYFAHRATAPTFLSGLALLQLACVKDRPVIEIACGAGHFMRSLEANGFQVTGMDLVFSKLWLARKYMNVKGRLICCDISGPEVLKPKTQATVFCHDAFYFFKKKKQILQTLRNLSNTGSLILGHVHTDAVDHGVSGHPISVADYTKMAAKNSQFYKDEDLVNYWLDNTIVLDKSTKNENTGVISWIENAPSEPTVDLSRPAAALHLNPVLEKIANDIQIKWPTPGYKNEYSAEMHYLTDKQLGGLTMDIINNATPKEKNVFLKSAFCLTPLNYEKNGQFGILGYGWVARDYMLKAIDTEPRTSLVAVCSLYISEMTDLPETLAKYTDLDEFLAHKNMDAVYIATPNHLHKTHTIACLNAGQHVLCEKPLATNAEDARAMIAFAKAQYKVYATAFDQRFHPAHLLMRALIHGHSLGKIAQVRLDYACWLPREWSVDNWRVDKARAGGGAIIDLAPHGLDLLETLLGDEIIQIELFMQSHVQDYEVDDGGVLLLRFASGVLGTMHVGYNRPDHLPRRRLEIMGDQGMLSAVDTMGQEPGGTLTFTDAKEGKTCPVDFDADGSPFRLQLVNFIELIRDHKKPLRSPEDDLRLYILLDNALKK